MNSINQQPRIIQNPDFVKESYGPGPKSISSKPQKPIMSGPLMNDSNRQGGNSFNMGDQALVSSRLGVGGSLLMNPKAQKDNKIINKNFDVAYNQLTNQLIKQELQVDDSQNGGSSQILNDPTKQDIIRHMIGDQSLDEYIKSTQVNTSTIQKEKAFNRLYKDHEYLKKKKQELHEIQKAKADEELKECTFTPIIYTEKANGYNQGSKVIRSKEQFLQQQQKFLKDKEEKLKKAKDEVIQKETGQANKKVKPSEFNEKEWIDRFTKREVKKATYEDPNTTFKPKISKKAEKLLANKSRSAFDELIEDSKKRQEKEKELASKQHKIEGIKAQEGSVQLLYQKFEKQFDKAYASTIGVLQMKSEANNGKEKVKYHQEPNQWREILDPRELCIVLQKLGFVEDEENENDQAACEIISQMLGSRLSRRNLLIFLSQLEKIHQNWMSPQYEGDLDHIAEDHKESYGVMSENGEYFVSEQDGKRIVKKFEGLRQKRLEYIRNQQYQKAQRYNQPVEQNSYHPQINQKSKKMAENKTNSLGVNSVSLVQEEQKSFVQNDRVSNLIQKGKEYELKKQQMQQEREKQMREQQYTFKPQIKSTYRGKDGNRSPEKRDPNQVFDQLYKTKERRQDVRSDEIEYERNKAELTFQPKISSKIQAQSKYMEVLQKQIEEKAEKSKELEEAKEYQKIKEAKVKERNHQKMLSSRQSKIEQGKIIVPKTTISFNTNRPQSTQNSVTRKSLQPPQSERAANQSYQLQSPQINSAKPKKSVRINDGPQKSTESLHKLNQKSTLNRLNQERKLSQEINNEKGQLNSFQQKANTQHKQ